MDNVVRFIVAVVLFLSQAQAIVPADQVENVVRTAPVESVSYEDVYAVPSVGASPISTPIMVPISSALLTPSREVDLDETGQLTDKGMEQVTQNWAVFWAINPELEAHINGQ